MILPILYACVWISLAGLRQLTVDGTPSCVLTIFLADDEYYKEDYLSHSALSRATG